MLIKKQIPGLYNGISQQPAAMRLDTQCEVAENVMMTIVDGVYKRPPTDFVAVLNSTAAQGSFMHFIQGGADEEYIMIVTKDPDAPVEVFRTDGTKCSVRYGKLAENLTFTEDLTVKDYLKCAYPKADLKALTIADTTLLVNSTITPTFDTTPEEGPHPTPLIRNMAIVWIKKGVADTKYTIKLSQPNGIEIATATHTTGTGGTAIQTSVIASALTTLLADKGFTITQEESYLYFTKDDGEDFIITVHDTWGEQAMSVIKNGVQKFSDLPPKAPFNYFVEIAGESGKEDDNYYVVFSPDVTNSPGVWKETVKPGLLNAFEAATMPHRLVRTGVNEFTFAPIEWEERKIGDKESAPTPSFIGNPIKDLFLYQDRLGFLAGENVILSRSSDYFNFWPTTALDVLDNDPIDISPASSQTSYLKSVLPFKYALLTFSDQQQFILSSGDQLFTPKSAAFAVATSYSVSSLCKPVALGSLAYFITPKGDYSALQEYFVQPDGTNHEAVEVTKHVPRYLPKDISTLIGSASAGMVLAHSERDPSRVYVYKYEWLNDEKVQSAWYRWDFGKMNVLSMTFAENCIWFVVQGDSQVLLLKMNLEKVTTDMFPIRVLSDLLTPVAGVYDSVTNKTTWTLPYSGYADYQVVLEPSWVPGFFYTQAPFLVPGIKQINATTLEAEGNFAGPGAWIGRKYSMRYRFSEWCLKDQQTGVGKASGKLQVRSLTVTFTNADNFQVEVQPANRGKSVIQAVAVPSLIPGKKRFMILSNSEGIFVELTNDTPFPSEFQTAEWEGLYTERARSI